MQVRGERLTVLLLVWGFLGAWLPADESPARPNVILCMADDLGWGDVGYHGHPVIQTPHLDAMAAQSLVLDRFYAGAPVCSPTRGSCLTGRHPSRYGIEHANDGHLQARELTLAEGLAELGYATGHFGKWHLGTLSPEFSGKGKKRNPRENFMTPGMAGFGEWFSTEYACATWDPYDPAHAHGKADPRALYWRNGENIADGPSEGLIGGDSRIIMDQALPFIEQAVQKDQPFVAVIWFHAPHEPVIAGPAYRALYPNEPENRQHYFGAVTELDEQMGRLRGRLRELGVAENTMLWFCSDNGPEGNPGPRGRTQGSAGPFRGRKRSLYEGGVRVAALLEWPARVPQSRKTEFPAVTSDIVPTVFAAVGRARADDDPHPLDGISLLPMIDGEMRERPSPIAFHFGGQAALSDNRYKLVHNREATRPRSDNGETPFAAWELYDLLADPAETRNLAEQHPEIAAAMRERLSAWVQSCRADFEGER